MRKSQDYYTGLAVYFQEENEGIPRGKLPQDFEYRMAIKKPISRYPLRHEEPEVEINTKISRVVKAPHKKERNRFWKPRGKR